MSALMVAAGVFAALPAAAAPAPTCRLQQVGDLPLTLDHGELVVEAEIDGKPVHMIVDTGAVATQLFRPAAEALGLDVKPVIEVTRLQFYGVGGKTDAAEARVSAFRMGTLLALNQDMLVIKSRFTGGAAGLLGMGFLSQADMEFDLQNGRLRFFKPKNCVGDQVVYWGKAFSSAKMTGSSANRNIQVKVQLDGRPILAEMDTGSNHSVLTSAAAAKVGVTPTSDGVVKVGESHGIGPKPVATYVAVFPTFAFGDETIQNAKLQIADLFGADKDVGTGSNIPSPVLDAPEMLLGADFFRAHRVYVALSQRMVYVSYTGGPVFQTATEAARPCNCAPPAN
jgi:clan AA aspartic protease (TIGR02281 family)